MLWKILRKDMRNTYLILSRNLWPRWRDQNDKVLCSYGLEYGISIESRQWCDERVGAVSSAEGRKGLYWVGMNRASSLEFQRSSLRNGVEFLVEASDQLYFKAARFDYGSRDAHIRLTVGKTGCCGRFKVYQLILWHASHQKMGCNSPPLESGLVLVTHF